MLPGRAQALGELTGGVAGVDRVARGQIVPAGAVEDDLACGHAVVAKPVEHQLHGAGFQRPHDPPGAEGIETQAVDGLGVDDHTALDDPPDPPGPVVGGHVGRQSGQVVVEMGMSGGGIGQHGIVEVDGRHHAAHRGLGHHRVGELHHQAGKEPAVEVAVVELEAGEAVGHPAGQAGAGRVAGRGPLQPGTEVEGDERTGLLAHDAPIDRSTSGRVAWHSA